MDNPKRILLAEDDSNEVELILTVLRGHPLADDVAVVRNGAEALDYLYRRAAFSACPPGHPILILLDLKMPKVDGIEVLRQIKADADLSVIPVVMLTSSREPRDLQECYQLGANAYVVKPVQFAEFSAAVQGLCTFWGSINEAPQTPVSSPTVD